MSPAQLSAWLQQAQQHHIRLPVILQGEQHDLLPATIQLVQQLAAEKVYWLGNNAPAFARDLSAQPAYQWLGSECDLLIINAFSGFNADAVAASSGCLRSGGLWLLLCPPFPDWQQQVNPAHARLLPWPLDAAQHKGHFLSFFAEQLQQQNSIVLSGNLLQQTLIWPPPVPLSSSQAITLPCRTEEQQQAVTAILKVAYGHRRRPLVLTADRGRGKSAALGIAAAELVKSGKTCIITGPSPQTAQVALAHFTQLVPLQQQQQCRFVALDLLLTQQQPADLVLVDEAAAIPTPFLQQLLHKFSRIVFATTQHGYEGTGRGFQLRFMRYLQQHNPDYRQLYLSQPIRYQQADPLEQLIFNCFLLAQNTESVVTISDTSGLTSRHYQAAQWQQHPHKLKQVFALLSLAHYQTQIKDLAALLDNPALSVITLEQNEQLLGCVLLSQEGQIPTELTEQIFQGARRLQGHLLAQSLAFHLAEPPLATEKLLRIMRIAVQPEYQQQGLGKRLLLAVEQLAQQQHFFALGTSFGVTSDLLKFWQQAGYQAIRLGHQQDKASGEYSILMLKNIRMGQQHLSILSEQFAQQLLIQCQRYFSAIEPEVITNLAPIIPTSFTEKEQQLLDLFSTGQRPFELIQPLLLRWFNSQHPDIPDKKLWCALLWQQQSWVQIAHSFNLKGKQAILNRLQQSIRIFSNRNN